MTSGQVTIHLVFPEIISQEAALACLTDEEKSRADRFRFRKDAVHWIDCRANLRKILGQAIQRPPREVPLILSENGKPLLAPPYDSLHFNLSHCSDLAIVALSAEGPVGIDLESLDRAPDLLECEATFCHPLEISELPSETSARLSTSADLDSEGGRAESTRHRFVAPTGERSHLRPASPQHREFRTAPRWNRQPAPPRARSSRVGRPPGGCFRSPLG